MAKAVTATKLNKDNRLKNFPVSYFSVIMGLAGYAIVWEKAVELLNLPQSIPLSLVYMTLVSFTVLAITYSLKCAIYLEEVKKEFKHPVKINFFPTISISLLLLSIAFLPFNPVVSKYFWIVGVLLHFIFTLTIISSWMHHEHFKIVHLNPAWFIPAVGNILVPVAGTTHFTPELSWFFFSIGLFFWIILMVIFFYRIFFHELLSEKFLPTLFILIAPPAVGFISYFKLTGGVDNFSKILYYFAIFLVILLLSQIKIFSRLSYYLSWWAYSFPLAAAGIATSIMYRQTSLIAYKYIFIFLLTLLSLLIALLLARTFYAIAKKQICIEE
jgi:tellurite resistance protein